ncbi:MAG: hypothetical protein EBS61_13690, partial [Betaproteobacteria bacterium]|nr:hypothetical protein [Betaproteobacteria bacterium]
AGMLARAQEMASLEKQLKAQQLIQSELQSELEQANANYQAARAAADQSRIAADQAVQEAHAFEVEKMQLVQAKEQYSTRAAQIDSELSEINQQLKSISEAKTQTEGQLHDANEFCKWLTKCSPPHLGIFTLPTEAEWEFACRCGSRSPFSFDDKESDFRYFANFNDGFSLNRKVPFGIMKPGQLRPNPWGLFDMHGNVWQFCSDRFGDFNKEYISDPTGPSQGSSHVIRGGSFAVNKFMGRSASRNKMDDFVLSDETTGFRLVLRPNSE